MRRIKGLMLTMMAGTLMLAAPVFAQSRGGRGGGGFAHSGGAQHFSGRSFSPPARGFSGGPRGLDHHDFRYGGVNRGYVPSRGGWGFGVGVYPGYAYPYGYVDPYYYGPNYAAPPNYIAPACDPNGGYYDANGNWIPDPNCPVPSTTVPPPAARPYGY